MYRSPGIGLFVLPVWLALAAPPAVAQAPQSLQVSYAGKNISLTQEDLAKLPRQTFQGTDHGVTATFQGVFLKDILAQVSVPTGALLKGSAYSLTVLVTAQDGYKVAMSLSEVDGAINGDQIYVAFARNGKTMEDWEGPFRLVIPTDKKATRWVRQVRSVLVKTVE